MSHPYFNLTQRIREGAILNQSLRAEVIRRIHDLLHLLARKLCNCGPYLDTDLAHHADYCVYRMEMEGMEGARHGD